MERVTHESTTFDSKCSIFVLVVFPKPIQLDKEKELPRDPFPHSDDRV